MAASYDCQLSIGIRENGLKFWFLERWRGWVWVNSSSLRDLRSLIIIRRLFDDGRVSSGPLRFSAESRRKQSKPPNPVFALSKRIPRATDGLNRCSLALDLDALDAT